MDKHTQDTTVESLRFLTPEQVKTAHALSQKVAKLNAATAAVAAVVTVTKAVADALQKFNGTVPGDEA